MKRFLTGWQTAKSELHGPWMLSCWVKACAPRLGKIGGLHQGCNWCWYPMEMMCWTRLATGRRCNTRHTDRLPTKHRSITLHHNKFVKQRWGWGKWRQWQQSSSYTTRLPGDTRKTQKADNHSKQGEQTAIVVSLESPMICSKLSRGFCRKMSKTDMLVRPPQVRNCICLHTLRY